MAQARYGLGGILTSLPGCLYVNRQGGPRRLWDAIESAVAIWEEYGSPNRAAFGVTAGRKAQVVWLGNPDGPQWPLSR